MESQRVAIIDLGTNSFHLLIVEVSERDDFAIRGRFKEMVKLGEGGINSDHIAAEAYERGIRTLVNFRNLIDSSGASHVFAFATSAIRSASNGKDFIEEAYEKSKIRIKTINGNEEAALIYEGVRNGIQLPYDEPVLLMDIGGGSVEFIVAFEGQTQLLRSLNIGAARLLERIQPSDPISKKEIKSLEKFLHQEMGGLIEELREFDLKILIGSSGTFESLATLVAYDREDLLSAENLNGYRFQRSHFEKVFQRIIKSRRSERMKMEGIETLRVDMIVVGVILMEYVLQNLEMKEVMVSNFALKEGILYKFIRERRMRKAKFMGPTDRSLRAKAVENLAQKYQYNPPHSLKVSEIATHLFDDLSSLHQMGAAERELLQYAAILHDIGRFVHPSSHHKHGQYIIVNSNLSGFSTNELVLLANVVRYHRKSIPKRDHYHFNILPPEEQQAVRVLAGILRIADNLDRGHRNLVTEVHVHLRSEKIVLEVSAQDEVDMEITHATEYKELLEEALGHRIRIRQKEAYGQYHLPLEL
jgi:exopolyphosphatase/guanosine-5'-triphosphate,3'-diphosphate pyrophosphatase